MVSFLAPKVKLHSFFDVPHGTGMIFDVVSEAIANFVVYVLLLHIIFIPLLSGPEVSPLILVLKFQNIPFETPRFTVTHHKAKPVIMGDKSD
jgi:hypothetical protein